MKKNNAQKHGLKIIIVGCGKVGSTLVEQLIKEGHDITIIDKDPDRILEITNLHDIMGIVGNGASYSVQMEAGISSANLIIAVTGSDELNLLCCTVATQVGDCAAIARVRTPDYSNEAEYLRNKLGLAMIINPELEAAKEAARILYLPTALEVNSFAHNQAELVKFNIPKGNIMDGISIAELGRKIDRKFLICAIERNDEVYIPSGDFKMQEDDIVSITASTKEIKAFLEAIGFKTNSVKNALIVGGGNMTFYLAEQLLKRGISVKIIDNDKERCETLSELLPKAIIINGNGTEQELLKEVGIEYADSFIPLTGNDEKNIVLTLYAKQVSNAKVITKLNRLSFKNVISSLNLGSVIYPKNITSEAIIAYIRAKKESMNRNIETLYHMFDSRAEAIEFRIDEESEITGIPIMDLNLKKDLLICFINRNGLIIIPSGQDSIQVGDTVMIVTTHSGFSNIQEILK